MHCTCDFDKNIGMASNLVRVRKFEFLYRKMEDRRSLKFEEKFANLKIRQKAPNFKLFQNIFKRKFLIIFCCKKTSTESHFLHHSLEKFDSLTRPDSVRVRPMKFGSTLVRLFEFRFGLSSTKVSSKPSLQKYRGYFPES